MAKVRADSRRWRAVRDAHKAMLEETHASRRASRRVLLARRRATAG